MIKATFNQRQLAGIKTRLINMRAKIESGMLHSLSAAGDIYYKEVMSNIGTHQPNRTTWVFDVEWMSLDPEWIDEKKGKGRILQKWASTGGIGRAVIKELSTTTMGWSSIFVGIDASKTPADYLKAHRAEFGFGEHPSNDVDPWHKDALPRPLFTTVSNVILAEFETGDGKICKLFRNVLINAVKTWGT